MFRHLAAVLALVSMMPFARAWDPLGHMLTMGIAYGKLPAGTPVQLDKAYVEASRACAEKRITLAGYRIAALLNRLLDPAEK
jgi:hypothetical protein